MLQQINNNSKRMKNDQFSAPVHAGNFGTTLGSIFEEHVKKNIIII